MVIAIIVIVAIIVIAVLYFIGKRNSIIAARNRVDESWSGIDVQLKRRHDLVPNLVETVKGYAAQEKDVLTSVVEARAFHIQERHHHVHCVVFARTPAGGVDVVTQFFRFVHVPDDETVGDVLGVDSANRRRGMSLWRGTEEQQGEDAG